VLRVNYAQPNKIKGGDKGWATPQLIETQKAQVGQLEAAIKTDQALIEAAKVQLSYTRLTSPIDGVVGIRQIDVGNIISPTTTNGLVVVTQLEQPVVLLLADLRQGDPLAGAPVAAQRRRWRLGGVEQVPPRLDIGGQDGLGPTDVSVGSFS